MPTLTFERDGATHVATIEDPAVPVADALTVEHNGERYAISIQLGSGSFVARPVLELTSAGRDYAELHYAGSITARVAIEGPANGWPATHVATAIRACNAAGVRGAGGRCV